MSGKETIDCMVCIWGEIAVSRPQRCLCLFKKKSFNSHLKPPTYLFSTSSPFENVHLFLVRRRRRRNVSVLCFSSFLRSAYPHIILIYQKLRFRFSDSFLSVSLLFFPFTSKSSLFGGWRGVTWDLRVPFFSLTVCVCLILKLGDSYLWQLRDSTHRDPPTAESGGGKKNLWHQHGLFHWHEYSLDEL